MTPARGVGTECGIAFVRGANYTSLYGAGTRRLPVPALWGAVATYYLWEIENAVYIRVGVGVGESPSPYSPHDVGRVFLPRRKPMDLDSSV